MLLKRILSWWLLSLCRTFEGHVSVERRSERELSERDKLQTVPRPANHASLARSLTRQCNPWRRALIMSVVFSLSHVGLLAHAQGRRRIRDLFPKRRPTGLTRISSFTAVPALSSCRSGQPSLYQSRRLNSPAPPPLFLFHLSSEAERSSHPGEQNVKFSRPCLPCVTLQFCASFRNISRNCQLAWHKTLPTLIACLNFHLVLFYTL